MSPSRRNNGVHRKNNKIIAVEGSGWILKRAGCDGRVRASTRAPGKSVGEALYDFLPGYAVGNPGDPLIGFPILKLRTQKTANRELVKPTRELVRISSIAGRSESW